MADITELVTLANGVTIQRTWVDQGDGTHALKVAGSGGGGGGGGDASAANQVTGNNTLTAISGKLPATLGAKATSAALAVSIATDDAQFGAKTTASAIGAGGSGVIGWLSDAVAQLKALVLQLPASLGIKPAAASLSVAPASDATFALTPTSVRSSVSVTRPANTTAYTAGDVVGATAAAITDRLDVANWYGPSISAAQLPWLQLQQREYRSFVAALLSAVCRRAAGA